MKIFLRKIVLYIGVLLLILICSLLFIPNKKITNNSLFANIDKHNRLDSLDSPKIIMVGGSNFAFGLDSKAIEERLGLPVVNMGLHAGFGLAFTLNEVRRNINQGDIVVLSPVYQWFEDNDDMLYGEEVLIALLFDVDRKNLKYIDFWQGINLFPNTISYSASKLFLKRNDLLTGFNYGYERVYTRNSFNTYGDESQHWTYENSYHAETDSIQANAAISRKAVGRLVDFKLFTEKRGARFYLVPPSLSYSNSIKNRDLISNLTRELSQKNISFAISPEKCNLPDSLFFNTAYHPNKQGVDVYTEMLIEKIVERDD